MSKKRQPPIFNPQGRPRAQLTTLSYDFPDGYFVPEHFHKEGQLLFASKGVMTIRTANEMWVVPPLRAVWIPAGEAHSIAMSGAVLMRTLFFTRKLASTVAKQGYVLEVSPLLRELILHACEKKEWRTSSPRDHRVIAMLLDHIATAVAIPLKLPAPRDERALRVVDILVADPSETKTLAELCRRAGGSKRTIERAFLKETGMTFGKWRQQLRLFHAMRLLAAGESVTSTALDCGYGSPSAFISVFKKALGQTPNRFHSRLEARQLVGAQVE